MRNRYKNLLRNKSLTFWGHIKIDAINNIQYLFLICTKRENNGNKINIEDKYHSGLTNGWV